ncbi:hypothetical protein [Polymorphobacter megasporae]|uniref:hypothetical protein n=1 Tax=Glacieibacterium megasporae TaxID=2835787 RepID=UPI001C1DD60D|nr:hypothetical protein [Polymorphobacter megasporae]UAJ12261.1 hypothetical protein KTC28_20745 [Polymorphobacter megasporae]
MIMRIDQLLFLFFISGAIGSPGQAAPPPAVATTLLIIDSSAEPIYLKSSALNTTLYYSLNGASATAVTSTSSARLESSASSVAKLEDGISSEAENGLAYYYDVVGATSTVPVDILYAIGASRVLPAPGTGDSPASTALISFFQNTFYGMIDNGDFRVGAGGGTQIPAASRSMESFIPPS